MNLRITNDQFWKFFEERINLEEYRFKFLKHDIQRMENGTKPVYDDSILNISGGGWILIMHSSDAFVVYGENWSENQFPEIKEHLNINKYKNYLMKGESQLIKSLLDFYCVRNYRTQKERIFYRCKVISSSESEGRLARMALTDDADNLALMLQKYYNEEYGGENDKELKEMRRSVDNSIATNSIFVVENNQKSIVSFCTIINPDIGILYTLDEYRMQGFGKIVLAHCSRVLLKDNEEIYLMTDSTSESSNIVVKKTGFEKFYNYSYIRFNNN